MKKVDYKDYIITIILDDTFSIKSTDNKNHYNHIYETKSEYQKLKYGIHIYKKDNDESIINSAIIINGGFSSIQDDSFIIENDNLILVVGNYLYSLTLIDLKVNWSSQCDPSCCFELYKMDNGYLVHGEQEITKVNINGNIEWSFSGCDIFASVDGRNYIKINKNDIEITDFENNYYKLDFGGKVIEDRLVNR